MFVGSRSAGTAGRILQIPREKTWKEYGPRGAALTEANRAVIEVAAKNKAAARIFVTGEAAESYIGEAAIRLLVNINDVLYQNGASSEPLFVQTRADTVRIAPGVEFLAGGHLVQR